MNQTALPSPIPGSLSQVQHHHPGPLSHVQNRHRRPSRPGNQTGDLTNAQFSSEILRI